MRCRSLGMGLALGCGVLLLVGGDFTSYAGESRHDVWATPPSLAVRLVTVTAVAVAFGTLSGFLLFLTTGLGFAPLRLFCVTTVGLTAVVYVYGDFKTVLGSGQVHYELPWGAARWGISAACGAALAAVTTAAVGRCPGATAKSS